MCATRQTTEDRAAKKVPPLPSLPSMFLLRTSPVRGAEGAPNTLFPGDQGEDNLRPLIAGNWKMNGLMSDLGEVEALVTAVTARLQTADVLICTPPTLIARAAQIAAGRIGIGGQDCHSAAAGAFTGDVSAEMLKDAGASAVIVGHSERRQHHGETDAMVAAKADTAWRAGLLAIICIGETRAQRKEGAALSVCGEQLAGSIPEGGASSARAIAYEPLWAIGSGQTPTAEQIVEMHAHIRHCLEERLGTEGRELRILYGGSVNPSNARDILALPEVGGALVGGSLKAAEFDAIVDAVPKSSWPSLARREVRPLIRVSPANVGVSRHDGCSLHTRGRFSP